MATQDEASPWEGVASGTTAAILANTIVYPLDVYGYILHYPRLYMNNSKSLQYQNQVTGPDPTTEAAGDDRSTKNLRRKPSSL